MVTPLAPEHAIAPDPIAIDPKHYKVELENEKVRVLRIRYEAQEKSPMHSHPDMVGVCLTPHQCRHALPDGRSLETKCAAGEVLYMNAIEHSPENLASSPFEVIAVELKTPKAASPAPTRANAPDPVAADSKHYKLELENEKVRVIRTRFGPREKSPMHSHPALVAVCLTPHASRHAFSDGRVLDMKANTGEIWYMDPTEHSPENLMDADMELILVELKF